MRGRVTVRESAADVNGTLVTDTPKNGKVRTVGLTRFLVELLVEHTVGQAEGNFVFTTRHGHQIRHGNFYARHFRPAVAWLTGENRMANDRSPKELHGAWPESLAGLRFHDLRHTAVKLAIATGAQPKAIQERFGHASITTTFDVYGHLFDDYDALMLEGLDRTFQAAIIMQESSADVANIRAEEPA